MRHSGPRPGISNGRDCASLTGTMRGPHNGKGGFVYLPAHNANAVLYTGVTANLEQRIWNGKAGRASVFTRQYHCGKLLYYELHESIETAIARESQLETWKLALVRKENPEYLDLAAEWYAGDQPEATPLPGDPPLGDSGSSPE